MKEGGPAGIFCPVVPEFGYVCERWLCWLPSPKEVSHVVCRFSITFLRRGVCLLWQEAQLPQRNSASAAHMEGLGPPAHSPPPPLATSMHTVESETCNKRTSSVPAIKRTLRWIGHSRSFKVILIGAGRNPERCAVVIKNKGDEKHSQV